jgi:hypothetical protein
VKEAHRSLMRSEDWLNQRGQMSQRKEDQLLILEVMLTTQESEKHFYSIPPYGAQDPVSIANALNNIQATLEKIRQLLAGEVRALEYPAIAYNPSHVVRVRISGQNVDELQEEMAQAQRRMGFATS